MLTWAWLLIAPLGVQAAAMAVDELHFHRKRGLGVWERVGHPLDTMTMLACIGWTLLVSPTARSVAAYVALAAFSCAFVTKDEFVHARRCSPGEHWLHAALFVVHPIALGSIGLLWPALHPPAAFAGAAFDGSARVARVVLPGQFALTAAFAIYQATYWNFRWPIRKTQDS